MNEEEIIPFPTKDPHAGELDALLAHVDTLLTSPDAYKARVMEAVKALMQLRDTLLAVTDPKVLNSIAFDQQIIAMHSSTGMLFRLLDIKHLFNPVILNSRQPQAFLRDMDAKLGQIVDPDKTDPWGAKINIEPHINCILMITPVLDNKDDVLSVSRYQLLVRDLNKAGAVIYTNSERLSGWHKFNINDQLSLAMCFHGAPEIK